MKTRFSVLFSPIFRYGRLNSDFTGCAEIIFALFNKKIQNFYPTKLIMRYFFLLLRKSHNVGHTSSAEQSGRLVQQTICGISQTLSGIK